MRYLKDFGVEALKQVLDSAIKHEDVYCSDLFHISGEFDISFNELQADKGEADNIYDHLL